jgi:hypothetical protein
VWVADAVRSARGVVAAKDQTYRGVLIEEQGRLWAGSGLGRGLQKRQEAIVLL